MYSCCTSSRDAVEKCIAAARPPDDSNKWIQRFGPQNCSQNNITSNDMIDEKTMLNSTLLADDPCPLRKSVDLNIEHYQELAESIEEDPITKFDLFAQQCLGDYKLFTYLANQLSHSSIEKIINHIYANNNMDPTFVDEFHKYFVPDLLRKEYNWWTQEIFIKSHKIYPKACKMLLDIVIRDITISNKVLEDFVESCDEKELTEIIITITDVELSPEQFIHNVFSIYTAYKRCKKSVQVQNLILTQITEHAQSCVNDKNFGRLLLVFLQSEKEIQSVKDYSQLEKIVETHRSAFKRPCWNCLQELTERYNASMDTSVII